MAPKQQAGWMLICIALFALLMYYTSTWLMTVTITCALLSAAYIWLFINMNDWLD